LSTGVADGDRQRRVREIGRLVWRVAPAIAAAALLAAAGRRWMGWSPVVPLAILGAGTAGLGLFAYLARRDRPATDEIATRLDADAGLGGELRSAAWFGGREPRDAWTELHLHRAAQRLRDVNWARLYPPVPAIRARAATTVMMLAAIGLTVTLPSRSGRLVHASASAAGPAASSDTAKMLELSPELQKKLEELLSGIEQNKLSAADAAAKAGELKDLLAHLGKLDPEMLKKLQKSDMAANTGTDAKKMDAKSLAERAKRDAATPNLPADLKKALQEIADQLDKSKKSDNAAAQQQGDGPPGPQPTASADGPKIQPPSDGESVEAASMQMARESGASAGAAQAMMTGAGVNSTDPNPGQGAKNGGGKFSAIEQALKRELVEAASDQLGDNVTTEIRRKTEQGRATASFTHAAAATFDRGHASAAPPVPDARRAQVQTYFIRKQ
jgi:hypothetical protein